MPDGEPLLARWFAIAMVLLTVVALVLTVVAFTARVAPPDVELPPAARRPVGSETVTHERGQVVLAETVEEEDGVACAPGVRLVGDPGGRATVRRALEVLCDQFQRAPSELDAAAVGLLALEAQGGVLRVALGAATGVDSSARVEDGVVVVELAPKFQFSESGTGAPFLAHELAHLGSGRWPGAAVDAAGELDALRVQLVSCELLRVEDELPRGCGDARAVLEAADPLAELEAAGYDA